MVGFGIYNHDTFLQATQYAKGAIVGSAFINHLTQNGLDGIPNFINSLLGN